MTTSRIVLPDGTGRTVNKHAIAYVGMKLQGYEFHQTSLRDIKGYTVYRIERDRKRDHFTFFVK